MDTSSSSMLRSQYTLSDGELKAVNEIFAEFVDEHEFSISVFDALKAFERIKSQLSLSSTNQQFRGHFVVLRNPINNKINLAQFTEIIRRLVEQSMGTEAGGGGDKRKSVNFRDSGAIGERTISNSNTEEQQLHRSSLGNSTASIQANKALMNALTRTTTHLGKWFGLVEDTTTHEWEKKALERYCERESGKDQIMGNFMTDIDAVAVHSETLAGKMNKRHTTMSRSTSKLNTEMKNEINMDTGEQRIIIPNESPFVVSAGDTPSTSLSEKQMVENVRPETIIQASFYHSGKSGSSEDKAPSEYVFAEWFGLEDKEVNCFQLALEHRVRLNAVQHAPPVSSFKTKWLAYQKSKLKSVAGIPLKPTMKDEHFEKLKALHKGTRVKPWFNIATLLIMLVVLAAELIVYRGITTIGVNVNPSTAWVATFGFKDNFMQRYKAPNLFIGPDSFTLLKMGAKYAPCMKTNKMVDQNNSQMKAVDTATERGACLIHENTTCAYLPLSGCHVAYMNIPGPSEDYPDGYQGLRMGASSPTLPPFDSTLHFVPGATCATAKSDYTVILRPCCIDVLGQCALLSKDQCDYLFGIWTDTAESCLEVDSCMGKTCGMGGFTKPYQFWRFVTPIFLHVGIIHFLMNAAMQACMVGIESSIGWFRYSLIFFISGIGGNIVSGIFSPMSIQAGSSGALYGLTAIYLIDIFQYWSMMPNVKVFASVMCVVILFSLLIGTIRYIDNFAHFGGFIYGLLAAIIFLPHVTFGKADVVRKRILFFSAVPILLLLFFGGFIVFYLYKGSFCPQCSIINCIPYTESACKGLDEEWNGDYDPLSWCNNRVDNSLDAFTYHLPENPSYLCEADYAALAAFKHDFV